MGTLKLSNRTASLLLCLLLQGGVFAKKLGKNEEVISKNLEQPKAVHSFLQKSNPNDAKDAVVDAALPKVPQAAKEKELLPVAKAHPVAAGPGNPAEAPGVSTQADEVANQPNAVHHPVLADDLLQSVDAHRPDANPGKPSVGPAVAQVSLEQQQQANQLFQAEPPSLPESKKAPGNHAADGGIPQREPMRDGTVIPQNEPMREKSPLHLDVPEKSPSSVQVIGSGQASSAGKASGNNQIDASPVNYIANEDKGNIEAKLPTAQNPATTSAPTTKATKSTPTTTVVPSGPSQDKEPLKTKSTNMLPDVPKDSAGIPPPSSVGLADYSHAREPDSEEELEPLAPKEPSPMLSGAASVGAHPVAGPAGDSRPEKPLDASGAAGSVSFPPAQDDSHFFAYFLTAVVLCVVGYLAFHNKRKILALILEGRHERQRRHNGHYRRLDSVDETSSSRKGRGSGSF